MSVSDCVQGLLEPLSFIALTSIRRAVEEGTFGTTNLGGTFSHLHRWAPPSHLSLAAGLLTSLISATSESRPVPAGLEAIQTVRVNVMRAKGGFDGDRLVLMDSPRFGVVREVRDKEVVHDDDDLEGRLRFSSVRSVEWDGLGDVTVVTHPLRLAPRVPGIGVMPGGRVWIEFVIHVTSPRCAVECPGDLVDHPFCDGKGGSVGAVEFFASCERHFDPLLPQIRFSGIASTSLMTSSMRAEMRNLAEQQFVAKLVARHSFLGGSHIVCARKSLTSSEIFHETVSVRPFLDQDGAIKVLWVVVERGDNTKRNGNEWSKIRLRGPLSPFMVIGPRWNKGHKDQNIPKTIWDGAHQRVPYYYKIDCTFDNQL
jgi:hypothetical protein